MPHHQLLKLVLRESRRAAQTVLEMPLHLSARSRHAAPTHNHITLSVISEGKLPKIVWKRLTAAYLKQDILAMRDFPNFSGLLG